MQENNKFTKKELGAKLSEKEYAALKAEHGAVFEVCYEDEDGNEKYIYLKRPTRQVLSLALNSARERVEGSAEVVLDNCMVHGDPAAQKDLGVAISIIPHVDTICGAKIATIKKL